jgi:GNAT superfamily N-acetyltransferase
LGTEYDIIMIMKIVNIIEYPEYLEILCDWHQEQWSYLNPGQTWNQRLAQMQEDLNSNFVPSTFIALEGDTLLGSAAILAQDMAIHLDWSPWLASVFVSPEHRRKGIGASLVKHVMKEAENNAVKTLYLYTPDAEQFYERLDWVILEQVNYYDEDVTIMKLDYDH